MQLKYEDAKPQAPGVKMIKLKNLLGEAKTIWYTDQDYDMEGRDSVRWFAAAGSEAEAKKLLKGHGYSWVEELLPRDKDYWRKSLEQTISSHKLNIDFTKKRIIDAEKALKSLTTAIRQAAK